MLILIYYLNLYSLVLSMLGLWPWFYSHFGLIMIPEFNLYITPDISLIYSRLIAISVPSFVFIDPLDLSLTLVYTR